MEHPPEPAENSAAHTTHGLVNPDNSWMADGLCKDESPNKFFPPDLTGVLAAKKICQMCDVRVECLSFALVNRIDHGIWGGTSERERRKLSRAIRLSPRSNQSESVRSQSSIE